MMTPDEWDRLHRTALRRTATEPGLIGALLGRQRETAGLTPDEQAASLGVPLAKLAWLAFCLVPGDDIPFEEYVAYLAKRTGAKESALGRLLRRHRFAVEVRRDDTVVAGAGGMMVAAHDADEPPADEERPDAGEPT